MTSTRQPSTEFAESRARAQREQTDQRTRAARTVAGQARSQEEYTGLLSMLGLDDGPVGSPALARTLAGYVGRVAAAVKVPSDAVGYEVSDTATAYLGLTSRLPEQPSRDLMLVWDERIGWSVGVETTPGEAPYVIGQLAGDTVPAPAVVAAFVAEVVAGRHINRFQQVPEPTDRVTLAKRMATR